jgi:hypothetical protein
MRRRRALHRALGGLAGVFELVPASAPLALRRIQRKSRAWRESAAIDSGFQRSFAGTQILPAALRSRLYTRDFYERFEAEASLAALEELYFPEPDARDASELEQFMLADLTVHMPSTLLGRLDRTSMAHSLEARVPLLSHKFVDWSLTMPVDMKARGPGKYALREAVRPWLPEGALERPKQGFQMPLKEWFAGDFIEFAREAWHGSGASQAGYLRSDALDRLADEHRSGVADHGRSLYAITIFSCWWADKKALQRCERASRPLSMPLQQMCRTSRLRQPDASRNTRVVLAHGAGGIARVTTPVSVCRAAFLPGSPQRCGTGTVIAQCDVNHFQIDRACEPNEERDMRTCRQAAFAHDMRHGNARPLRPASPFLEQSCSITLSSDRLATICFSCRSHRPSARAPRRFHAADSFFSGKMTARNANFRHRSATGAPGSALNRRDLLDRKRFFFTTKPPPSKGFIFAADSHPNRFSSREPVIYD